MITLFIALATLPATGQLSISRVQLLPDRPKPFVLRDWKGTALAFDHAVFDYKAKGVWLPLIWPVPRAPNLDKPGFGLPSYVGKEELRGHPGESIAALGSLLGASEIGMDKRRWVELTPEFLNPQEGVMLNNAGGKSGESFWYDLLPNLVFTQLASRYPYWTRGRSISQSVADSWLGAVDALHGNFDHTGFRLATHQPADNGQWKEPDSAAAIAYLELFENLKSGQPTYLQAARKALRSMQNRDDNPTYEVLTAFGVQSAAYLNATKGDGWDVSRFLNWCFDPTSPNRVGWGMVTGSWGGHDVGGLMGSTNDGGGYAFAMNTFLNLGNLAPVARYDDRYSASLAKWILNATNASRLFYKDSLPASLQSGADWVGDAHAGIAYEALRKTWDGKSPFAAGDAKRNGWAKEDFGLYGGGYVGLLAALVHPTNVPEILRIDLRATDFLPTKAFPTDLYWNPYEVAKTVNLDLGSTPVRLYDAVSNRFLSSQPVKGSFSLHLNSKQAVQVVKVPPGGELIYDRNQTFSGSVPIDFNNGRVPLPAPKHRTRKDDSLLLGVAHAAGGSVDWSKSNPMILAAGKIRVDLRFGWDNRYLFFRMRQLEKSTETVEAPSLAEFKKHRWDFEHLELSFDPSKETFPISTVPEASIGWSSSGVRDLAYSDDLPAGAIETTTSGTAAKADRQVEGRISWAALYQAFGTKEPLANIVKSGSKIACQPLLTDGTFKRQAYLNGKPYTRPNGFDKDSRTLVLR